MLLICAVALSFAVRAPAEGLGAADIPVTFQSAEGWVYDGRIELPAASRRKPWAVVLLGGAYGTDIDWTMPGDSTIDGKPTRDAAAIAQALLDAGYVVMRWKAIRRDDPYHAKDPMMLERPSYQQTVDHVERALQAFRAQGVVPDDHLFLLGHSNGARRAVHMLDRNVRVAGLILMAGGSMLPADHESVERIVHEASGLMGKLDIDENGSVDAQELKQLATASPGALLTDRDFDGGPTDSVRRIDIHELTIHGLLTHADSWNDAAAAPVDRWGERWSGHVVSRTSVPTLLIYGTKDPRMSTGYLMAAHLRQAEHPAFELRMYDGLGHHLSEEKDGKTGPIADRVIRDIVAWLNARTR